MQLCCSFLQMLGATKIRYRSQMRVNAVCNPAQRVQIRKNLSASCNLGLHTQKQDQTIRRRDLLAMVAILPWGRSREGVFPAIYWHGMHTVIGIQDWVCLPIRINTCGTHFPVVRTEDAAGAANDTGGSAVPTRSLPPQKPAAGGNASASALASEAGSGADGESSAGAFQVESGGVTRVPLSAEAIPAEAAQALQAEVSGRG